MKKSMKSKSVDLKFFIVPFLLITLLFTYLIYGSVTKWVNQNYGYVKSNAVNVARVYSENLNKSLKAKGLLYELIDERLKTASSSLAKNNSYHSNVLLMLLAKELNVDVIYSYDRDGVVQYSSSDEFIGWKAEEGHPVYDYMVSGKKFYVENIRYDSVSGKRYKYSYTRLSDGRFFQVGVSAESIEEFLHDFEMDKLLGDIGKSHTVEYTHFINLEYRVEVSTNDLLKGLVITDPEITQAMDRNQEVDKVSKVKNEDIYEVYVPVYLDSVKIGTLAVGQNVTNLINDKFNIIISGIFVLLIIMVIMGMFIVITYNKTYKHMRLAYFDPLTKLPNNHYMKEFLDEKNKTVNINNGVYYLGPNNDYSIEVAFYYSGDNSNLNTTAVGVINSVNKPEIEGNTIILKDKTDNRGSFSIDLKIFEIAGQKESTITIKLSGNNK